MYSSRLVKLNHWIYKNFGMVFVVFTIIIITTVMVGSIPNPTITKVVPVVTKYKVKYQVTCPYGIDGRVHITDYNQTKLIEFSKKTYPPKLQTIWTCEIDVSPPFNAKLHCFADCEDITISIFINGDLVESQKVDNGKNNELFWKLLK